MTSGDGDAEVEALRVRVGAIVADWDATEEVTMFGCPSFTARGELFGVVSEQGLSLTRLPEGDRTSLADVATVGPFDAAGRTIDSWATIAAGDLPDDETLASFVRASYDAAVEAATG